MQQMVMGNEAIALGALAAGVNLAAGYPGTPSSEIIECVARYRKQTGCYVEWSVNEKAAVEVAAGASACGARVLVTMKQVGLNVASDPVMCLSYVGVKGGMVIVSADDPGPISSQTEQDTRRYASFAKLPVFDPSSVEEAFVMTKAAFELSECYGMPVILRPTTRIDHAYASLEIPLLPPAKKIAGFEKDSSRWVIFPRLSFLNHKKIFERDTKILPEEFSKSEFNFIDEIPKQVWHDGHSELVSESRGDINFAIAAGGAAYAYAKEALVILGENDSYFLQIPILKIGTPYPFPDALAKNFLQANSRVLVLEELDGVIEDALTFLKGRENLHCEILGKYSGHTPCAGEFSVAIVKGVLEKLLCVDVANNPPPEKPELPVRPPVLCAGCPHRAAFYAVKLAMKNQKTVFCGDIGCYTLGNAAPLEMCDTCLCMGAGVTMAQGFFHAEADRHSFSFIGDSTFFASGITGVANAVYNKASTVICVLDNSTTAMTGHQVHPGTGRTMMGDVGEKISIEKILQAIGVNPVLIIDPLDLNAAVDAVKQADANGGVSAIIFRSPCVALFSRSEFRDFKKMPLAVDEQKCVGCKKCVNELGCPALTLAGGKAQIDATLCSGCNLCGQVCVVQAIRN